MSGEARIAIALIAIYWAFLMPYVISGSIKMNHFLKQTKIQYKDE